MYMYSLTMLPLTISFNHVFRSTATANTYTRQASMKTFRELEKLPPDQQQKLIAQVLKETLPAAKDDLIIDEMRPLLIQNGVITNKEATELLGIFSGEEKVTRLYTKMLPNKGLQGLEQYMRILYDTGWDTPSHMRHHGALLINLSVSKLTNSTSIAVFLYIWFRTSFHRSRVMSQFFVSTEMKRLQGKPLYPWFTLSHYQML